MEALRRVVEREARIAELHAAVGPALDGVDPAAVLEEREAEREGRPLLQGPAAVLAERYRAAEFVTSGEAAHVRAQALALQAAGLYREAAAAELEAFGACPPDQPGTRGILAGSMVALLVKAGQRGEAEQWCYALLQEGSELRVNLSAVTREELRRTLRELLGP